MTRSRDAGEAGSVRSPEPDAGPEVASDPVQGVVDDLVDGNDEVVHSDADDVDADEDIEDAGIRPPFVARSFGGEFVWAEAPGYVAKILRVRPGEKVVVSTRGRRDMVAMLTGGRAVLEVINGEDVDRVEMMPAGPIRVTTEAEYRLVAMTDVELFTIYTVE